MSLFENAYKKVFIKRYDGEEHLNYFTHKDFEGLNKTDVEFPSAQNNILRGGIYSYEGAMPDKLVIFCHGIGAGHLSYMREIEYLCKNGYEVLAYDNTGCVASDGENIRGLAQSLSDLDSCLDFVFANDELKNRQKYVIGHSWGGFAAGNIWNIREDIEKTVVISSFASIALEMKQFLKGPLAAISSQVMKYEKEMNPQYAELSSDKGLNKPCAKALVIHSADDHAVRTAAGIDHVKSMVTNPNVEFLLTQNKKHNPNYTEDAVSYMNERFAALNKAVATKKVKTTEDKKEFMKDVDWYRMTEQDDSVWKVILDFLRK